MDRKPLDIERELDEVVGKYEPRAGQAFVTRAGRILARALAGASLALAAVAAIVYVLHYHLKSAQTAPGPGKPITVHIVPR